MKALVTGGAGFIGSHLVEALLEEGHEAIALDDLSNGRVEFLEHVAHHPRLTFVRGDVRDADLVRRWLKGCDVVFHLAAVLGVKRCMEQPLHVIEANLDGTRAVLQAAHREGVKVVFASTSEVYGKNPQLPYKETSDRVLGGTDVHRWCYATGKALDEHLCFAYAKHGLRVTVVRYFNAYGPRATATPYGGVIPRFIRAALRGEPLYVYGTGRQRRCFTYVSDLVRGTLSAASKHADGQVFNVGSLFESSIHDLALLVRNLSMSTSPVVTVPYEQVYGPGYEDSPRRVPDLTRAAAVLGYQPKVDLRRGLLHTIAWFLAEGSRGPSGDSPSDGGARPVPG
ncbi:MAG: NAD-dependent epimerase/dehydratase family protein [Alicyclobacillus sp.]|nr:NAD-dependent epimerase/dehydratase family protein [Alicyclobacillus sp.]